MVTISAIDLRNGYSSSQTPPKERKSSQKSIIIGGLIYLLSEQAYAAEIEPLGKALAALLGTTKVFKKSINVDGRTANVYYSKNGSGKVDRVAFIEQGIYEPNCTHTWAIGIVPATGKVTEVRPIEMSCSHALPTKSSSFLGQFKGKGPAEAAKLEANIDTIAKATGSCKLAAQAVSRSIIGFSKIGSQL